MFLHFLVQRQTMIVFKYIQNRISNIDTIGSYTVRSSKIDTVVSELAKLLSPYLVVLERPCFPGLRWQGCTDLYNDSRYCICVVVPPKFDDPAALHSRPERDAITTAISGEPVRLRCMVHAVPAPQITWYKNGEELRLDDADEYLLSRDGRELVIKSATIDDTAKYTCIARNLAGQTEKNFDLTVHGLISWSFSIIIIIYSHQIVQTISISSSISCNDSKEQLKLPSLVNNSSSKSSTDALSCAEICSST